MAHMINNNLSLTNRLTLINLTKDAWGTQTYLNT